MRRILNTPLQALSDEVSKLGEARTLAMSLSESSYAQDSHCGRPSCEHRSAECPVSLPAARVIVHARKSKRDGFNADWRLRPWASLSCSGTRSRPTRIRNPRFVIALRIRIDWIVSEIYWRAYVWWPVRWGRACPLTSGHRIARFRAAFA
jgi:hypothetical protein